MASRCQSLHQAVVSLESLLCTNEMCLVVAKPMCVITVAWVMNFGLCEIARESPWNYCTPTFVTQDAGDWHQDNNLEIDDPCSITKSLEEIFGERMFDHAVVWPRNYVRRCRISCQKGLRSIHQVEVILHVVALPKLRSPGNWNYMMMFNHANSHATPFIGNHGLMMIMNMSMLTWDEEYCARVYKMLYAHSAC